MLDLQRSHIILSIIVVEFQKYCPFCLDGEWLLMPNDVECLAVGAGILGCGGGGDPNIGRVMALRLLREDKEIRVVNPCR